MPLCEHATLVCEPVHHVTVTDESRPKIPRGATRSTRKRQQGNTRINPFQFPAPLVLPGDSLALDEENDEEEEPQSFEEWKNASRDRNKVTKKRNIIYIVPPPRLELKGGGMEKLSSPFEGEHPGKELPRSDIDALRKYLEAFYDGIRVKIYNPPRIAFVPWNNDEDTKKKSSSNATPGYIGLEVDSTVTRIRTRRDPGRLFSCQLNVEDLLDATIDMLPKDAYAMAMVVHQDLYEDEEDLFICGRAYGGSRVAVVSSARYHPSLDQIQNVDREHAWPASHCRDYVMAHMPKQRRKKGKTTTTTSSKKRKAPNDENSGSRNNEDSRTEDPKPDHPTNPLAQAIAAHKSRSNNNPHDLPALWLSRLCRTISHELGHCFGIAHCLPTFACAMQSSASVAEDARQPPYLCPECVAKVLHATGSTREKRYGALERCLDELEQTGNGCALFLAYREWLRLRTVEVDLD